MHSVENKWTNSLSDLTASKYLLSQLFYDIYASLRVHAEVPKITYIVPKPPKRFYKFHAPTPITSADIFYITFIYEYTPLKVTRY